MAPVHSGLAGGAGAGVGVACGLTGAGAGNADSSSLSLSAGLSQSNTSNHLSCLTDCGLVSRSQKGRNVIYQMGDLRVDALLVLAEQLLSDAARGVYECTRYNEKEAV